MRVVVADEVAVVVEVEVADVVRVVVMLVVCVVESHLINPVAHSPFA